MKLLYNGIAQFTTGLSPNIPFLGTYKMTFDLANFNWESLFNMHTKFHISSTIIGPHELINPSVNYLTSSGWLICLSATLSLSGADRVSE